MIARIDSFRTNTVQRWRIAVRRWWNRLRRRDGQAVRRPLAAAPGPAPVSITYAGHTALLKWHRARRRADDAPFTTTRIVEGMLAGASVEVDLRIHGDGGFTMLHDRELSHETTGAGSVRATPAATLRSLEICHEDGVPCGERMLLLEDLAGLLGDRELPPSAILQLDFKDSSILDDRAVAAFAAAARGIESHLILSCSNVAALTRLTDAAPGVSIGYDPCGHDAAKHALSSGDFAGFVDRACAAAPSATTFYLEIPLVLGAADQGFNLIEAFHRHGRTVDAYTFGGRANKGMVAPMLRLLELGADQLTVDDPEGIAALLESRG